MTASEARRYYEKFQTGYGTDVIDNDGKLFGPRDTDRRFGKHYNRDTFAAVINETIAKCKVVPKPSPPTPVQEVVPDRKLVLYNKLRDDQLAQIERDTVNHKHRIVLKNATPEADAKLLEYGYTRTRHQDGETTYDFVVELTRQQPVQEQEENALTDAPQDAEQTGQGVSLGALLLALVAIVAIGFSILGADLLWITPVQ